MDSSFPYLYFLLFLGGADFPFCPLVRSIFLENPSASLFPFSFLFVPHLSFAIFWYWSSLCSSLQFQAMFRFTSTSVYQVFKSLPHALCLPHWFLNFVSCFTVFIFFIFLPPRPNWDACRSNNRMKIGLLNACLHTTSQTASLKLELIHTQ